MPPSRTAALPTSGSRTTKGSPTWARCVQARARVLHAPVCCTALLSKGKWLCTFPRATHHARAHDLHTLHDALIYLYHMQAVRSAWVYRRLDQGDSFKWLSVGCEARACMLAVSISHGLSLPAGDSAHLSFAGLFLPFQVIRSCLELGCHMLTGTGCCRIPHTPACHLSAHACMPVSVLGSSAQACASTKTRVSGSHAMISQSIQAKKSSQHTRCSCQ